jgi:hypothetical protein
VAAALAQVCLAPQHRVALEPPIRAPQVLHRPDKAARQAIVHRRPNVKAAGHPV